MEQSIIFNLDNVTIIRKKGPGDYIKEDITTLPILQKGAISVEQNRCAVISRLLKDPSVLFIFDAGDDGHFHKSVSVGDGFSLDVEVADGASPYACCTVLLDGHVAARWDSRNEEDQELIAETLLDTLCEFIIMMLTSIDEGEYGFVDESCPGIETTVRGPRVSLLDAGRILEQEGFQTESVHTAGNLWRPVLFVHENEVVMLGSQHFNGTDLFLEMKRLFIGVKPRDLTKALVKAKERNSAVKTIEWEDGSWSFRIPMDDDLDEETFLERLSSDLALIRDHIGRVEEEVGAEPWPIMQDQRQYFIYEAIDASIKLSQIKI